MDVKRAESAARCAGGRSVNGERGSGAVGGLPVADEYFGDRVTLG